MSKISDHSSDSTAHGKGLYIVVKDLDRYSKMKSSFLLMVFIRHVDSHLLQPPKTAQMDSSPPVVDRVHMMWGCSIVS